MELRHLRYFVAVAEELNFTRAAARLHMAQPPLSQQIRLLEREVGAQLLDRSTRHVALTVAGAAFLDEARRTLAQAERAIRRAKEASGQITSSLSVAFVESASSMYLPEVVRRFRCGHPLVRIELRQHTTSEIAASLARGEADVGLLRPTRAQPAVVLEEIGNVRSTSRFRRTTASATAGRLRSPICARKRSWWSAAAPHRSFTTMSWASSTVSGSPLGSRTRRASERRWSAWSAPGSG